MINLESVEALLTRVPGVKAAKIVSEGDEIVEIHIVADSEKSPKQVVRDIETVLLASTGLKIDRRIISVAQIKGDLQKARILPYSLTNLKVEEPDSRTLKVSVVIEHGNEEFYGDASGPKTSRNVPIIIGNAILNALSDIHDYALSIDDTIEVYLAGKKFIITHLTKEYNAKEESIIGAAEVENDKFRAIAESVLDAFRRI
ncbi:MAG: hypothetical protein PWP54_114 [Thermosipho sp. (in: thermotogales)]|nr:hypothetical protein [Thermosipho sp. (in: thermotogales)]